MVEHPHHGKKTRKLLLSLLPNQGNLGSGKISLTYGKLLDEANLKIKLKTDKTVLSTRLRQMSSSGWMIPFSHFLMKPGSTIFKRCCSVLMKKRCQPSNCQETKWRSAFHCSAIVFPCSHHRAVEIGRPLASQVATKSKIECVFARFSSGLFTLTICASRNAEQTIDRASVSQRLSSCTTSENIPYVTTCGDTFHYYFVAIYLLDEKKRNSSFKRVRQRYLRDLISGDYCHGLPLGKGLIGRCRLKKKNAQQYDVLSDRSFHSVRFADTVLRCFPLLAEKQSHRCADVQELSKWIPSK